MTTWKFLPELPDSTREVLIAIKYADAPIQGWYSQKYQHWVGSTEVRDQMIDGFVEDGTLISQSLIYAWTELPEMPEFSEE